MKQKESFHATIKCDFSSVAERRRGDLSCRGFGGRWNPDGHATDVCCAVTREKIELLIVGHDFLQQVACNKLHYLTNELDTWVDLVHRNFLATYKPFIPDAALAPSLQTRDQVKYLFHSHISKS